MSDDDEQVQIVDRVTPYRGYLRVDAYRLRHKVFDRGWSDEMHREVMERGHAVGVLPYDPVADRVVLIEQFRIGGYCAPGFSPWQIECIAGMIEPGHEAEETARREAREEADLEVGALQQIAHYLTSPGGTSESIRLYCGHADSGGVGGIHGLHHEHEFIRVFSVPAYEAFDMIADGRVANSMTVIALQWLKLNRELMRDRWGPHYQIGDL
jgi:ADP-ribose pyrophosphatase